MHWLQSAIVPPSYTAIDTKAHPHVHPYIHSYIHTGILIHCPKVSVIHPVLSESSDPVYRNRSQALLEERKLRRKKIVDGALEGGEATLKRRLSLERRA